jgi:tRNA nucleotidyltransferase (CCA-adding enzyme)
MALHAPEAVRWICSTLEGAGFECWAVGGAVRDSLAGNPSEDWDLTTRARPREVMRLFPRTVPIGVDHGTVGVIARDGTMYEVTTFRRDVETTGRHAVVAFADTLDADLGRRDFTINAVAWHPLRETVHDPFGGIGDMEARILRTVGAPEERFREDYLRILRALRFAGRFHLRVDPPTWRALCEAVPNMGNLSPERVRDELDKILAGGADPSKALALEAASGVLGFFFPELEREAARHHLPRALRTVDLLPLGEPEWRLAAFLSATGGTEGAVAILLRLRSSNRRIREVGALAGGLARLQGGEDFFLDPLERRRWLSSVGRELTTPLMALVDAWGRAAGPLRDGALEVGRQVDLIREDLRSKIPLSTSEMALSGRDLIREGYRPGPHFGWVLEALLKFVHEDPTRNTRDWLLHKARTLLEDDPGERS